MIPITTRCLKCLETGVLAIILKREAIAWAWEFLTDVLKFDKDSLYVTVFEGSEEDGLTLDKKHIDFGKQLYQKK